MFLSRAIMLSNQFQLEAPHRLCVCGYECMPYCECMSTPSSCAFPLINILADEREAVAQNEKEKATSLSKCVPLN